MYYDKIAAGKKVVSDYHDAIAPHDGFKVRLMGTIAVLALGILRKDREQLGTAEQSDWKRRVRDLDREHHEDRDRADDNYVLCRQVAAVIRIEWGKDNPEADYPFTRPTELAISRGASEGIKLWEAAGGKAYYGQGNEDDVISLVEGEGGFWTIEKRLRAARLAEKVISEMTTKFSETEAASRAVHQIAVMYPGARHFETDIDRFHDEAKKALEKAISLIGEIKSATKQKHIRVHEAGLGVARDNLVTAWNQAIVIETAAQDIRRNGLIDPRLVEQEPEPEETTTVCGGPEREPETVEPEMVEPEMVEPEQVEPEAVESETVEPEVIEPEQVEPEAVESEMVEPEVVEPEQVEPARPPRFHVVSSPKPVQPETPEPVSGPAPEPINDSRPPMQMAAFEGKVSLASAQAAAAFLACLGLQTSEENINKLHAYAWNNLT